MRGLLPPALRIPSTSLTTTEKKLTLLWLRVIPSIDHPRPSAFLSSAEEGVPIPTRWSEGFLSPSEHAPIGERAHKHKPTGATTMRTHWTEEAPSKPNGAGVNDQRIRCDLERQHSFAFPSKLSSNFSSNDREKKNRKHRQATESIKFIANKTICHSRTSFKIVK